LLGVAEGALIQLCLNVLTDDDLKALVSVATEQSWHGKLLEAKERCRDSIEKSEISMQESPVERLQVILTQCSNRRMEL